MYGQFKFLTVNKLSDWEQGTGDNILFAEQGLSVLTDYKYGLFRTLMQTEMGIAKPIATMSSSPSGLLFIVDEAANIWTFDYVNHQTTLLLKEGHGLFSPDCMLAVAPNTLYLLSIETAAIIAISISNGQILWINENFLGGIPVSIMITDNEGLLVVTSQREAPEATSGQPHMRLQLAVLKITHAGLVKKLADPPSFYLLETSGFSSADRIRTVQGKNGELSVLDSLNGEMWIFSAGGLLLSSRKINLANQKLAGLGMDHQGNMYTAAVHRQAAPDQLHALLKFQADEPEGMLFYINPDKVDLFWMDRFNRIYIWNQSSFSLTILVQQQQTRPDSSGKTRGTFVFPLLDCGASETEWHRIVLDADIPEDTQIRLSYFSSDHTELVTRDRLLDMHSYWQDEISSLADKLEYTEALWGAELINPRDALFRNTRGRYLYLKAELIGSENSTPLLRSVRIYYPRMSLLSYLPSVYQEDDNSRDFLACFLALFGSFLQDMEEKIDHVYKIFDPQAVSGPFLNWLAGWLDLSIDENWTQEQVQHLLLAAPSLFKKRGTRAGMEDIIAIYTGEKPLIVEYFQYKYLQEVGAVNQLMSKLYNQDPYCFTVLVKQDKVPTAAHLAALQRIIEEEKPAFTEAKLVVLQPWIYMDMHSYLGINTYLSELSLLKLDNKSAMPFSSLIIDTERDDRFNAHTRMELDARLK